MASRAVRIHMPKKLVVLAGPDEGRDFTLGSDPLLLGRSRATDGHLLDPHVSRVHCQVQPEGEMLTLIDFDSPGGTFVNGKRISRHTLQPGDIIRIGNTRLQFVADGNFAAGRYRSRWLEQRAGGGAAAHELGQGVGRAKVLPLQNRHAPGAGARATSSMPARRAATFPSPSRCSSRVSRRTRKRSSASSKP